MPIKKTQNAATIGKARSILAEKKSALHSETTAEDLWNSFQSANLHIQDLELGLAQKKSDFQKLSCEFEEVQQNLASYKAEMLLWKKKA